MGDNDKTFLDQIDTTLAIEEQPSNEESPLTEDEVRQQIAAEVFEGKKADLPQPEDAEIDEDIETPGESFAESIDVKKEKAKTQPELPEELQNQISAMSNKLNNLDAIANRLKQAESRLGAMQNEFYAAKKEAEQRKAEGIKAPSKEEMAAASGSKEAWEDLKEEFPEWADAFQYRIDEAIAGIKPAKQIQPEIEALKQTVQSLNQRQAITPQALQKELLSFRYPGWERVIQSNDYKIWLQSQPDDIKQKALYGQTAQEAGVVLNAFHRYKQQTNKKQTASQARLQQAVNPQTGGRAPKLKSEKDMTEEELRAKIAAEVWGDG